MSTLDFIKPPSDSSPSDLSANGNSSKTKYAVYGLLAVIAISAISAGYYFLTRPKFSEPPSLVPSGGQFQGFLTGEKGLKKVTKEDMAKAKDFITKKFLTQGNRGGTTTDNRGGTTTDNRGGTTIDNRGGATTTTDNIPVVSLAFDPNKNGGVYYLHATEDTKFSDLINQIEFSEGDTFAIAKFDNVKQAFLMTEQKALRSKAGSGTQLETLADSALDTTVVKAGEVVILVSPAKAPKFYGVLEGSAKSEVSVNPCETGKAGWNLFASNTDDIYSLLAKCSDSVYSVWTLDSSNPVTFTEKTMNALKDTRANQKGYLVWVSFSKNPVPNDASTRGGDTTDNRGGTTSDGRGGTTTTDNRGSGATTTTDNHGATTTVTLPTAPAITVTADANGITVKWNKDSNVDTYTVGYKGKNLAEKTIHVTDKDKFNVTINDVTADLDYGVYVTVTNKAGSTNSEVKVVHTPKAQEPKKLSAPNLHDPSGEHAAGKPVSIKVTPENENITQYKVSYLKKDTTGATATSVKIDLTKGTKGASTDNSKVSVINYDTSTGVVRMNMDNLQDGTEYTLSVLAIDKDNQESPPATATFTPKTIKVEGVPLNPANVSYTLSSNSPTAGAVFQGDTGVTYARYDFETNSPVKIKAVELEIKGQHTSNLHKIKVYIGKSLLQEKSVGFDWDDLEFSGTPITVDNSAKITIQANVDALATVGTKNQIGLKSITFDDNTTYSPTDYKFGNEMTIKAKAETVHPAPTDFKVKGANTKLEFTWTTPEDYKTFVPDKYKLTYYKHGEKNKAKVLDLEKKLDFSYLFNTDLSPEAGGTTYTFELQAYRAAVASEIATANFIVKNDLGTEGSGSGGPVTKQKFSAPTDLSYSKKTSGPGTGSYLFNWTAAVQTNTTQQQAFDHYEIIHEWLNPNNNTETETETETDLNIGGIAISYKAGNDTFKIRVVAKSDSTSYADSAWSKVLTCNGNDTVTCTEQQ